MGYAPLKENMDISKLPEDTVPWSTLSVGDCFIYPSKEDIFIKLQDFKSIQQYNASLNTGECFGQPKDREMQVIPINVHLSWNVKRNVYK